MFQPGAALSVVKEVKKHKIRIVALQEVRWNDEGTINKNYFTILHLLCYEIR